MLYKWEYFIQDEILRYFSRVEITKAIICLKEYQEAQVAKIPSAKNGAGSSNWNIYRCFRHPGI